MEEEDWAGIREALAKNFLFAGYGEDQAFMALLGRGNLLRAGKGQTIAGRELGLVVTGSVAVINGGAVVNLIAAGGLFRAAAVFGDASPTEIAAREESQLLLLSPGLLLELFEAYPDFLTAYLAFLARRIQFLSQRIRTLTAGSAEERLYLYLKDQAQSAGSRELFFPMKGEELARALNMGRASLYRAFDQLTLQGKILRSGRRIRRLED